MKERAYKNAINSKYNGYQKGIASMVYNFFDEKKGSGSKANVNEVLSQELYKPMIKRIKKKKSVCED